MTLSPPRELTAALLEHRPVAPDAGVLVLGVEGELPRFAPGQFLQLRGWGGVDPLLSRPFSILDQSARGERPWLSVLYQVHGRGTALLGALRPGDRCLGVGPLGKPFTQPTREGPALIVAGGVGIPPFLLWVRALVAAGREAVVLLGARDAAHLYLREELAAAGAHVAVATEDGSAGTQGRVTELLTAELEARGPGAIGALYACGPEGMLQAVAAIARRAGVPGQLSLERMMACGYGVCFTCVCRLAGPDGRYKNVRTCLDGPVVDLARLPEAAW